MFLTSIVMVRASANAQIDSELSPKLPLLLFEAILSPNLLGHVAQIDVYNDGILYVCFS